MKINRREFLKGGAAALACGAFGGMGRVLAVPPLWKPSKPPALVFGVISDTHLRTGRGASRSLGKNWPDKYLRAALECFKREKVDAVAHCGDFAHRGQVEEMQFHANAWRDVFGSNGPAKLFVTGNHDAVGADYGDFVASKYPDPAERAKHVLATDMAANWERIWGEKYEPCWHKEIKGFHFFGRNWFAGADESAALVDGALSGGGASGGAAKPCFFFQHRRPEKALRMALRRHGNLVAFFGHNHWSATNWNIVSLYYGTFPCIECASCEPRGCAALVRDAWIARAPLEKTCDVGGGRHGYVVSVYDDMAVVSRREFGMGGCLGNDWLIFSGKDVGSPGWRHPLSMEERKKLIGEPQFPKGAALEVSKCFAVVPPVPKKKDAKVWDDDADGASPRPEDEAKATAAAAAAAQPQEALRLSIPRADGNPDSRAYAFDVVVAGDAGEPKLFRSVYAGGCNLGMGHEPDNGATTMLFATDSLPKGNVLKFGAMPVTSLGTRGKAIVAEYSLRAARTRKVRG